jgi:hypothetical protein
MFCDPSFSFLSVVSQKHLSNLKGSGILGMSPYDDKDNRGDLFILKMKKANVIDQAVFSLYINLHNHSSKITFGGFNLTKFASPNSQNISYH